MPTPQALAYYNTLINAWNAGGTPAGATGTALVTTDTTANKIAAVNSWTVAAPAQKAIVPVYAIINAIVPADFLALTATQLSQITLLFGGNQSVDASPGTTIRAVFQSIFAGKPTTLANLGTLVASYDSPRMPWWQASIANGGAALSSHVSQADCDAAGLA